MARKFPNMPPRQGGGNMMKQAQKMQEDMIKMQEELNEKEFRASSGGGMVTAAVNGQHELKSIEIKPEAVDPEDVEMLEDLIVAAVNAANKEAEDAMAEEMSKITGGLSIPGLF